MTGNRYQTIERGALAGAPQPFRGPIAEQTAGTGSLDGLFGMITPRRAARDNRKTGRADGEA